uniref:VWFA domain-containing protein n=1 Tax=Oryza punctata TaxID=4537 RepID=A0A0E0MKL2_ORYPU
MAPGTMSMGGIRCTVCFAAMGAGQAIFTAECSHTFHLRCVPGATVCPVCATPWRDAPSPLTPSAIAAAYDDDDPVEPVAPAACNNSSSGVLVLKTHCEYPALSSGAARDGFAVLVHAKAPAAAAEATGRAPLDLVTVLDVSTSMTGDKLALVKRAMGFVIDSLGAADRLSVVAFATDAHRVLRLTRLSEDGKVTAKRAVDALVAHGNTNIRDGLDVAAKVLDGRRHTNAVASVILLSDGQDNQSMGYRGRFHTMDYKAAATSYDVLVPPSFTRAAGERCAPVHAFGFGTDHDAAAMHSISEITGGTFSFIENLAVIQDTFARCIGGLLSVAAQKARISVECLDPGVRVRAVKSGRYESCINAEGRAATVDVGELYADEERRFLLLLDVPRADGDAATRLVNVRCTYRDTATGQSVDVAGEEDVVVLRPLDATGVAPSMEVERERVRLEAMDDIVLARAAAERGAYGEAARILDARREALSRSAPAASGDAMCAALVAELRELSERVADEREYAQTGRACVLAGMSSHGQQRASSVRLAKASSVYGCSSAFATPAMQRMEKLSEISREQQQQQAAAAPPPPPAAAASKAGGSMKARFDAALPRIMLLRKYRRFLSLRR